MNNVPFWELTLSGIIVSWPGVLVTVWLSHRGLKRHLDRRTDQQTGDIRGLTDAQTHVLLSRRKARLWERWHREP